MTPPDWPRMMKRATAAAYLDLSEAAFEREVMDGVVPMPVKLGGREHWCRLAIDAAMDRLTGDHIPDWRASSPLYNPALQEPQRVRQKKGRIGGATTEQALAHLQRAIDAGKAERRKEVMARRASTGKGTKPS